MSRKSRSTARYAEIVRQYVIDHGTITNGEMRELLSLGDAPSARVSASRLLAKWSGPDGFLERIGTTQAYYLLRSTDGEPGP